ncbi:acyl-CoA dehydrogenase family protein [Pseudorhodoferax soli]|uniref:Acetyl-CoA C-acetyltransferase n=1 Tax=Pseudorhodoferax soli TaxID=545864 RepID=A0A368XQN9_9BURK|nr:acyl-CoA dehydrogenase family protein [Pseudorhodoferax soli]RCW69466.1 acetyl-CoA C-acetyltransferase [Pseudorhodoferax soli]
MDDSLVEGLRSALAAHCSAEQVRALEAGGPMALWQQLEPLGYADAFMDEAHGGSGLDLAAGFEVGFVLGLHACPLPLLETALARALLAAAGVPRPARPMVLCDAVATPGGALALPQTPGLQLASHALVQHQGHWHLLALAGHTLRAGDYRPRLSGALDALVLDQALARFPAPHTAGLLTAPLQAAEMAGAMSAVLAMTLAYAQDRRQFGRPIGQFQALQMEVSALAEQVAYAGMAARLGCAGSVAAPSVLRALNAKLACCEAAGRVVAIAHAVHGAIGITEEYALAIHARRLHEWRAAGASAGDCARALGRALLGDAVPVLAFVRGQLGA